MSHDYSPDWDYPVEELTSFTCLSAAEKQIVSDVVERVRDELASQMGFDEGLEVFFVANGGLGEQGNRVGLFCSGTSSRPVLGVDLELLKASCLEKNASFEQEMTVTLAHELGHAYQESMGLDMHDAQDSHEDETEEFARIWADSGVVRLDLFQEVEFTDDSKEPLHE